MHPSIDAQVRAAYWLILRPEGLPKMHQFFSTGETAPYAVTKHVSLCFAAAARSCHLFAAATSCTANVTIGVTFSFRNMYIANLKKTT